MQEQTFASALSKTSFGTPEDFAFLTMFASVTFSSGSGDPPARRKLVGEVHVNTRILARTSSGYNNVL
jgi:hypothetical protein